MNTYVDTSALVKRIVVEEGSEVAREVWEASAIVCSTRLVVVETRAALAAARRVGRLTSAQLAVAKADLNHLTAELTLLDVTEDLVAAASELAEEEALRGYDAVHLAAALSSGASVLTSADAELCEAARRRGLAVANPLGS